MNSFREGQHPELDVRETKSQGLGGLKVVSEERTVNGLHPEQRVWVTCC